MKTIRETMRYFIDERKSKVYFESLYSINFPLLTFGFLFFIFFYIFFFQSPPEKISK